MLTAEQRTEAEQIRAAALRLEARARAALPTASPAMQKRLNEDLAQLENIILTSTATLAADGLPPKLDGEQLQRLAKMMSEASATSAQMRSQIVEAERAGDAGKAAKLQNQLAVITEFISYLGELSSLQEQLRAPLIGKSGNEAVIKSGFGSGPLSFLGAGGRSN